MHRTLKKNSGAEFKEFFEKLHHILKESIRLWAKHGEDGTLVPESEIQKLQNQISGLAGCTHADKDCKRYAKRLRRERDQLLTFLRHDGVPYHNNASERALRPFALMRKVCYGNRSRRGIGITETLMSVYATCEARGVNP